MSNEREKLVERAQEILAACLSEWGHPQEAENVLASVDLESYDTELRLINQLLNFGFEDHAHRAAPSPPADAATQPAAKQDRDAEMQAIGRLIATQDNRVTDQPIFIVQQKQGRSWVFVTACFTEQGCKDYLALDGHNLREPRIYAAGSFRNEEFRAVRQYLMGLAAKAAAPAPDPLPPELEGTLSPMAEMAEALRRKAEIERERYEDRRQSGEWGPAPDAGTQADFCPSCDGSGWDGESRTDLCPACNGGREPEPRKAAAPAPGVGEVVAWMRRHVTYAAVDGRTAGERVVSERQVYPDDIPLYTAPPAPQGDQVSAAFVAGYRAGGHDYTSSRITDLEELDRNAREHPNAKEIATRVAIAAQAGEVGNG